MSSDTIIHSLSPGSPGLFFGRGLVASVDEWSECRRIGHRNQCTEYEQNQSHRHSPLLPLQKEAAYQIGSDFHIVAFPRRRGDPRSASGQFLSRNEH